MQFVEEWDEDYKPVLIMEYAAGGDLRKQIDNEMGYGQIGNFAMQTLSALEFTHGQNIMHRDLKPENILCPGPNRYILADFGLSKDVGASASRRGTDFYMAPEIDGSSPYDCKVDMWSLGVILSECLKGLPAGGPNPGQIQRWCQEVAWHFEQYYKQAESERQMAESSFFTIMRIVKDWLLILEPEERSSAEEIQQLAEPELWDAIFQEETFDPASDAITPSETNEDGSFEPSPLESSTSEETNGSSSLTNPSNITTRTSPVGPRTLYDPACVEPSPSFASDQ